MTRKDGKSPKKPRLEGEGMWRQDPCCNLPNEMAASITEHLEDDAKAIQAYMSLSGVPVSIGGIKEFQRHYPDFEMSNVRSAAFVQMLGAAAARYCPWLTGAYVSYMKEQVLAARDPSHIDFTQPINSPAYRENIGDSWFEENIATSALEGGREALDQFEVVELLHNRIANIAAHARRCAEQKGMSYPGGETSS